MLNGLQFACSSHYCGGQLLDKLRQWFPGLVDILPHVEGLEELLNLFLKGLWRILQNVDHILDTLGFVRGAQSAWVALEQERNICDASRRGWRLGRLLSTASA